MKTTHICPVCLGKRKVPAGFYSQCSPSNEAQELCQSCNGLGYIVLESENPLAYLHIDKSKLSEFLDRMDRLYTQKLQRKTGWGKNEVLNLYRDCTNKVLLELGQ